VAELSVFEAIHTLRAVRRYRPDPVPEAHLARILRAGTMASSSGNTQPWEFLVLTDPDLKRRLQTMIAEAFVAVAARRAQPAEALVDSTGRPVTGNVAIENIDRVPVLVLVFWNPERGIRFKDEYRAQPDGTFVETRPSQGRGSSLFLACQNMLLAAQALGLGSLFTTFAGLREADVKALLGVPPTLFLEAMLFIGYPDEPLGRPRRRPIETCTHLNRWGTPYRPPDGER
jgi:nitroreductase